MDLEKDTADYVAANQKLEEGVRAIVQHYDRHRRRLLADDLIHLEQDMNDREEALEQLMRELTDTDYTEDDIWILLLVLEHIALTKV